MKSKTDQSFGIIPIKKFGNEWKVFLILQFSKIGNNSYWVFPKGHAETGESPEETAKRELFEETGMKVKCLVKDQIFTLKYSFTFSDQKINKTVQFFVGVVEDGEVVLQEEEVKEAGWYSLSEAAERLDYQDTKFMFAEAKNFINNYQQ